MANKDVSSQSIVQGIIDALRTEFGADYTYYANKVPQNFKEPAFSVRQISANMDLIRGRRYLRRGLFRIVYFAGERKAPEQEMNAVADRLYPVLEYIKMGDGLIRGTDMEHETEDEELHFTVHYDIFVMRPRPEAPLMQKLELEVGTKEQEYGNE